MRELISPSGVPRLDVARTVEAWAVLPSSFDEEERQKAETHRSKVTAFLKQVGARGPRAGVFPGPWVAPASPSLPALSPGNPRLPA